MDEWDAVSTLVTPSADEDWDAVSSPTKARKQRALALSMRVSPPLHLRLVIWLITALKN